MTWYAVFDGDGNLVSSGTVVADDAALAAAGYSKVVLSEDPTGKVWNPSEGQFEPPPAPPIYMPTWEWIQRFTPEEYAAIKNSADPAVSMFLLMLTTTSQLNIALPVVQNGLSYLVSQGILSGDRAAEIGAS